MGAWGTGNFENDDALDFVGMLTDLSSIQEVLQAVLIDDYLDVGIAASGLAAAEIIAALRGNARDLPPDVQAWIANVGAASGELVTLAQRAVRRVLGENSELRELWEETDEFPAWQTVIHDLLARLTA